MDVSTSECIREKLPHEDCKYTIKAGLHAGFYLDYRPTSNEKRDKAISEVYATTVCVAWYHHDDAICCWNRRHVSFLLFYSNDIVCI